MSAWWTSGTLEQGGETAGQSVPSARRGEADGHTGTTGTLFGPIKFRTKENDVTLNTSVSLFSKKWPIPPWWHTMSELW